jgi:hypothetical protein
MVISPGNTASGDLHVQQVIYRFLDDGDLHNGFTRHKMSFINGNPHFMSELKVEDK